MLLAGGNLIENLKPQVSRCMQQDGINARKFLPLLVPESRKSRHSCFWKQVHVPVLLIYGEHDQLVPVDESLAKIAAALDTLKTSYTAIIVPGAQHNLTIQPEPGQPFFWWKSAPGLIDLLVAWVQQRASELVVPSGAGLRLPNMGRGSVDVSNVPDCQVTGNQVSTSAAWFTLRTSAAGKSLPRYGVVAARRAHGTKSPIRSRLCSTHFYQKKSSRDCGSRSFTARIRTSRSRLSSSRITICSASPSSQSPAKSSRRRSRSISRQFRRHVPA